MDDSTAPITVCYGGNFVTGEVWKYVGGSVAVVRRYLYDDGSVRDLVYHFLHHHEVYVYVETVGAEYEEIVLEAGIESEVGDRSVLEQDRISEDTEASLTARVLEICEQLEKSGGLGDDEEETLPESSSIINLGSWDVALSNDDDEETLLHTIYESDVDDEDIAVAREEVRAYQQGRKASIGVVDEGTSVNQDCGAPTADRDDTEYEQSGDNGSSSEDRDNEDVAAQRTIRRRYPSYNSTDTSPMLCLSMSFDDAKQFREAIVRDSITHQRNIKFTSNTKDYVRAI
ncbi:uncharacterized protein LOC130135498 [Syzygium oleosum]|uniref:uncharacterized protein LOC130135498 n=1 Tax=Syzygium oleosum TaxID=219896 RepID=UPI0024B96F5B|nr:uncharacterized protein LOC130135498 [Syzygium oleosum]